MGLAAVQLITNAGGKAIVTAGSQAKIDQVSPSHQRVDGLPFFPSTSAPALLHCLTAVLGLV